jgi:hypothetical protein
MTVKTQNNMQKATKYQNQPGEENGDWNQKPKRVRDKVHRNLISYEF